ncbi:MAG: methionine synthase [Treponema sp.]|jgi:5-methyltetrahydrofolate--homocysteine methyltransferase|nr:methionine synthase [Treponema sp.]
MTLTERLNEIASRRVIILDGAMGSLIQGLNLEEADFRGLSGNSGGRFAGHSVPLQGCNDILCLTRPDVISAIHKAYLEAGADITKTCSFNATSVSLVDYGIGSLAREISRAAAALARQAADEFSTPEKPRFVAGSIGPTAKSASLSPDVNDPAKRGIYWDELETAYYDNVSGLVDGGVDILLVETVYDTLNAKAALSAIRRLLDERNINVPVMISATVASDSGRLLAGQTLAAFCTSVLHAEPWAIGLNCSFGAEKLLPHVRALSGLVPCLVSAHPNAGLPNQLGGYDETPLTMAASMETYLREGLVNIAGGCCGSTPAHIGAIAEMAARYQPRSLASANAHRRIMLAGLEPLPAGKPETGPGEPPLILIGERTNVAGSRKFLRLITEEKYMEAAAFARHMISSGAHITNVGMDDAMLDAEKSMCMFLDTALSDTDIAKAPVMIDSSRWNVIEAGLKRLPGKGLVNSINLKDGEAEFVRRAAMVKRYGAAVVVMLIDERGQAETFERKIETAARAYRLLTGAGFPPEDIVIDPNVLAVATGISEHDSCALDFIRSCAWIRENCPGVHISGGISNLSFSFRGNNTVREAMHSVFLYHAVRAGLDMAIVNHAAITAYNDIEANIRSAVEDVILNRRPGAAERLLELAGQIAAVSIAHNNRGQSAGDSSAADWRTMDAASRIIHAMVNGLDDFIGADVLELQKSGTRPGGIPPLEIVEGPLMEGMKTAGRLFGEGKLYLPQVIRSARVMKKAVAALEPLMNQSGAAAGGSSTAPKIVLATVKGDVHDIGKNIVGVVLGCNGYHIIDLGVMVPAEQIISAAMRENAGIIGLSGLISPSLDEMITVAREMEKLKLRIPLLIGGAAASLVHTALRIAPEYSGPVVYVSDAGKAAETVRALLSDSEYPAFTHNVAKLYREAALRHEAVKSRIELLPVAAARANKFVSAAYTPVKPETAGIIELNGYPLERVIPWIDWPDFLRRWQSGTIPDSVESGGSFMPGTLLDDAQAMLEKIKAEGLLKLRGLAGIFPAVPSGDDIVIQNNGVSRRFCFLRNQTKKPSGANSCLADFLHPAGDWLGLFVLSAGFGLQETADEFRRQGDDYGAILLATLANTLTEAFTEEVHLRIRREWWGYAPSESLSTGEILAGGYAGIRPAFGYPASPDHHDKETAFTLLQAWDRSGFALTGSAMIIPAASVCGMFFANPAAYYFGAGRAGNDQLADWAERKGISIEEARRRSGAAAMDDA